MPSAAYYTARVLFRHGVEVTNQENELASEEQSLRAQLDREHADAQSAAKAATSRPAPSGGRAPIKMPSHEGHIDNRVARISKLRDKHADRRKAMRDRHARELTAARNKGPVSGKHPVQTAPEPHEVHFDLWKNLDSARRQAIGGVEGRYATLHDDVDSNHVATVGRAGRYMGSQATADDAQSRHKRSHPELLEKKSRELSAMVSRLENEIAAEKLRIHQQAVERGMPEKRHYEENSRAMGRR